ncbi:hypothetical protein [uncultured Paludibaculum sp.]|uniref:hypothetical protein n=1 Tax=uncultured Paludibaculum sp. TaxID=1765020 RepID=UPI002AAA9E21|nr:hypothetical protein [uncultured Paludibaculum sp.]
MSNRIAFNPQDRFVVSIGGTLMVTTRPGDTFGHDITGHTADRAFQFAGAKAAFNAVDRFVTTMGNKLIVITQSGDVFGHEVSGRTIGPAFRFAGSKAAFNAVDRFVVTIGNMLIVTTQNGDVFGHDVSGHTIGPPFKFAGSKAAFNAVDRFVVTIGNMLIVTTQNGDVFGHDVSGHTIGPPFKLTGSRMAFNPVDRFVVTVGNTMIVTTQSGAAFGADLTGRDIGPIFRLNPDLSIRLHLKVWTNPTIPIQTMLTSMQDVYGTAGIGVVVASREDLTGANILTSLRDLDVVPNCPGGQLTGEQIQLFNNRDNVGEFDVVAHFVRSTSPVLNGCASHPNDLFGAAITQIASVWTMAHEIGHVLGLSHIDGENTNCPDGIPNCCSTPNFSRLMTGCSTSNIVGTPILAQSEIDTLRNSSRTRPS